MEELHYVTRRRRGARPEHARLLRVPFERLALIAIPYVLMTLAVVVALIVFPQLVLFLPNVMRGG